MEEKIIVRGVFKKHNAIEIMFYVLAAVPFLGLLLVDVENPFAFLAGISVFIVLGLFFMILFRGELIVTNSKVTGKTIFGKKVNLPINQISTIATGIFKRITIATSSGSVSFYHVANKEEVCSAVSDLISKNQNKYQIVNQEVKNSVSEELIQLKKLLDSGIISQEEFDAKKKQLLGL